MAHSKPSDTEGGIDKDFTCSICFEIFEAPIEIPCGHSFCKECIKACLSKVSNSQCPICRTSFTTVQMKDNTRISNQIESSTVLCTKCNQKLKLSTLRLHKTMCIDDTGLSPVFKSTAPTDQPASRVSNRSTFKCPYCEEANMDTEDLRRHVNDKHKLDRNQVVCPICASMPWGNSEQMSGNFHQHLNLRHKFNYDTYVDFDNDEEKILHSVIQKSMEDQ